MKIDIDIQDGVKSIEALTEKVNMLKQSLIEVNELADSASQKLADLEAKIQSQQNLRVEVSFGKITDYLTKEITSQIEASRIPEE